MERDFDKNPYTPEEARVAEFICNRGMGGGDDPVGFILASYAYLVLERNELLDVYRKLVAALTEARSQLEAYELAATGERYNNLQINAALARCSSQVEQP